MVGTLQALGILFLCMAGRVGYMAAGTPTITVDYIQWMNEQVREGRDESLNARPYYEKAIELSKKLPEPIKAIMDNSGEEILDDAQWDAIEKFLVEDAPALEAFQQGAAKPYYWNKYSGQEETRAYELPAHVVEPIMPALSKYKALSQKISSLQIPWKLHTGDIQGALNDCMDLQRVGWHIQGRGLLIEGLVGIALEAMASAKMLEIVGAHDYPPHFLKSIQNELENQLEAQQAVPLWELEKAFWYDSIQRTFTDDGQGSGRMLLKGMPFAVTDWKDAVKGLVFGYPERRQVLTNVEDFFEDYRQLAAMTPWRLRDGSIEKEIFDKHRGTFFFAKVLVPAFAKMNLTAWQTKMSRTALLTVLAILQYEEDNRKYPQDLEKLVETGYLKELPLDPFSDGPLVYRKTDEGFTLYSVGTNFKDDGGQIGWDTTGITRVWADEGDVVFWPVE